MKRSQLVQLIKEALTDTQTTPTGYEKKDGKLIPHFDKFDSTKLSDILTRIAKQDLKEDESSLTPDEIKEKAREILGLGDLDVSVRFFPVYNEIKFTVSKNLEEEPYNRVIEYLEDNGYTVNLEQSTNLVDTDGERTYFPKIRFK